MSKGNKWYVEEDHIDNKLVNMLKYDRGKRNHPTHMMYYYVNRNQDGLEDVRIGLINHNPLPVMTPTEFMQGINLFMEYVEREVGDTEKTNKEFVTKLYKRVVEEA